MAKVGLEAVRGVKTINEFSQMDSVHSTQVGLWKKYILEGAKTLFEGKRGPKPVAAYQEPDRLYGEIGYRDWLKNEDRQIPLRRFFYCRKESKKGGISEKWGG